MSPCNAVVVPRLASSLTALETLHEAHNVHRFTLVDQFTLENCLLWFNRSVQYSSPVFQSSSPVQYSSPVVQSSEWIHPFLMSTNATAHIVTQLLGNNY